MPSTLQFYRDQAAAARRDADDCGLANVRERWLCAAAAWDAMAARLARAERNRAEAALAKAVAAAAG